MQGSLGRLIDDGEHMVNKGLGRARIHKPMRDGSYLKIDLFTTHMISYKDSATENRDRRYRQAYEIRNAIMSSDADVKIFGGKYFAVFAQKI